MTIGGICYLKQANQPLIVAEFYDKDLSLSLFVSTLYILPLYKSHSYLQAHNVSVMFSYSIFSALSLHFDCSLYIKSNQILTKTLLSILSKNAFTRIYPSIGCEFYPLCKHGGKPTPLFCSVRM